MDDLPITFRDVFRIEVCADSDLPGDRQCGHPDTIRFQIGPQHGGGGPQRPGRYGSRQRSDSRLGPRRGFGKTSRRCARSRDVAVVSFLPLPLRRSWAFTRAADLRSLIP
jgi:hypothetical protein